MDFDNDPSWDNLDVIAEEEEEKSPAKSMKKLKNDDTMKLLGTIGMMNTIEFNQINYQEQ